MSWLAAIPVIGQVISLMTSLINGSVYGVKWLVWKIGLSKLKKEKEKIQNAETPSDWTDIINK